MIVDRIKIASINQIENSRGNVDKELPALMNSIQQHGLQQPIGLNHNGKGYDLMYGNRRLRACIKLGWTTIPAVLYSEKDNKDFLIHNLVENIQRQQLSPVEIGRICEQLEKLGLTLPEIAVRLDMKLSMIEGIDRLYKDFPKNLREKVIFHKPGMKKKGSLTVTTVAKAIVTRNRFGLKKSDMRKIMEHVEMDNLSGEDIQVIGSLMTTGKTFRQSLRERKNYRVYRVPVIALKEEVDDLAAKHSTTPINFLMQIVYGLKDPISKPTFVEIESRQKRASTK